MDNIIQIKGLKKSYNENLVFESISLNVNRNSIFWIKGVNGSGKSTLMKIVASQIEDYEGDIFYENNNIRNIGNEIHNQIFYLPSSSALYQGLTAFENIKFFSSIFKSKDYNFRNKLIKDFQVNNYINKRVDELSDGIKKRVSLLISFLIQPEILLLDEPYSFLDTKSVENLNQIINEYISNGVTLLVSDNSFFVERLNPDSFFEL
ncbi:MAG: ABC transporter ATP-binding protein [Thermodesulfobacteriota bacterium]|nr:ABC transporter ATP-binding protein [Thermodesulfobacteriota bacterium]